MASKNGRTPAERYRMMPACSAVETPHRPAILPRRDPGGSPMTHIWGFGAAMTFNKSIPLLLLTVLMLPNCADASDESSPRSPSELPDMVQLASGRVALGTANGTLRA